MKIHVHYFFRKRENHKKSLEGVFDTVIKNLSLDYEPKMIVSEYVSTGFFNRLRIALAAASQQGSINHVTGDIHFIVPFLRKQSTVLTIHDCGQYQKRNLVSRFLYNLIWIKIPAHTAGHVTVISDQTRREMISLVKIPESKISVIHNPIKDLYNYNPKTFNNDQPRILHIGTKGNKNLQRVIRSVQNLDIKLVIIGKTNEKQKKLLEKNRIQFENKWNLSEEELLNEYKKSDILLFASTYEGFGLPIIEANAVGRVVVTSNISPMKEIAGNAALLVDPYNESSIRKTIIRVMQEAVLREKLIKNGLVNIERFKPLTIARQYEEVYRMMYERQKA